MLNIESQASPQVSEACVQNPPGTFTSWFVRADAGGNTEWSTDGITWVAATPAGTITPGNCLRSQAFVAAVAYCVEEPAGTFTTWYRSQANTALDGNITTVVQWTRDGVTFEHINSQPPGTIRAGECAAAPSHIEVYRLDGSSGTLDAVPEVPDYTGHAATPLTVGRRATITGSRVGLSIQWLPQTDNGARITVNGRGYSATNGPVFVPWSVYSEDADYGGSIESDVTIEAFPTNAGGGPAVAYVEVFVQRKH